MRVAVVLPHLDDAALSIGGTIHKLVNGGADLTIVTVFAGEPTSTKPPSYWDAGRGAAQGEVVRQRRQEDLVAAGELGAAVVQLPWSDSEYAGVRNPDEIWVQLRPEIAGADVVFVPGWPLGQGDHRYVTKLVLEQLDTTPTVVFYAEQPYVAERLFRSIVGRKDQRARERAIERYAGEVERLSSRASWGRLMNSPLGEWLGVGEDVRLRRELGIT